jgi:hypothetical protein
MAFNQPGAVLIRKEKTKDMYDRVPIRLNMSSCVFIELPNEMTEEQWTHMMSYLEVMKLGFVTHNPNKE